MFLPDAVGSAGRAWRSWRRGWTAARDEVLADAQLVGRAAARCRRKSSRSTRGFMNCRSGCWTSSRKHGGQERGGADSGGGRSAGAGGRQRRRAGHRRVVHGRAGAAGGVLPSVPQRGRDGDAARPAADVFRGEQCRQRRAARSGAAVGEPRRSLGHRRDQQERRHAGDGGGVSHSAARAAGDAGRRSGASSASWSCR